MSITLDGTNGITSPDVVTNDGQVYAKENILGTVSQSAGVPTGAIIERGSNANGEFVRYADGTQICTRLQTFSFTTTVFAVSTFNWAAPFVNSSYSVSYGSFVTVHGNRNAQIRAIYRAPNGGKTESSMTAEALSNLAAAYGTSAELTAIGRWY